MRVTEPYTIFPRKLSSGKTVYYYQFRDEYGRRSSAKSTGCTTLAQARRFCRSLYNSGTFSNDSSIRFSKFTENFFSADSDFIRWKEVNRKQLAPETLRRYLVSLHYQLLPYFGNMKLSEISTAVCRQWVMWGKDKWSDKTVNNAQGVLNLIMKSAVEQNLISRNPVDGIDYRKLSKKNRDLLTVQELNLLYNMDWVSETHRQIFLLSCITGMRIGEISALQKTDLHQGYLTVSHSYSERYGLGDTKTHTVRVVPVPEGFQFPPSDSIWLFKGDADKPLQPHALYNNFTRLCDRAGIDRKGRGLTYHTLRNFFISYMKGKNVPELKVKAVVGHADASMTDHYTYWSADMFREITEEQDKLYKDITKEIKDNAKEK